MYPVVVAVLVLAVSAEGFYLPGLAPVNYCQKGMFEESKCQVRSRCPVCVAGAGACLGLIRASLIWFDKKVFIRFSELF